MPAVATIGAKTSSNGLSVAHLTLLACLRDLVGGADAHDVHNVHGAAHAVRNDNGAVGGFRLDILGARQVVALGPGDAHVNHILLSLVDEIAVLCVNLGQCTK